MGLFGGSKSYSTSTTQQFQETNTQNSDLAGNIGNENVLAGSNNTVNQEFGDNVAGAFENLVDLTGATLEGLVNTSNASLAAITDTQQQANNPDASLVAKLSDKILPVTFIVVASYILVTLIRK
jgi:hypothetical protein